MSTDQRHAGEEEDQFGAARRAVRAVASAFRTLRLYPLGHALTTEALGLARRETQSYASVYGTLAVLVSARGLGFDFRPQPYSDDLVADLARSMRARGVPGARFLRDVTTGELGDLLFALHQPLQSIERAGGMARWLAARGVQNIVVEDASTVRVPGADLLEPLLEAAGAGAADRIGTYLQQTGGDQETVRGLLRAFDRRIVTWPRAAQLAAWKAIGQTLASLRASWQASVCAMVVRSVDEPWAASVVSQWPPVLAASLVAQAVTPAQEQGRRVADVLRSLNRPVPRTPLPDAGEPDRAAVRRAREEFTAWTEGRLRAQAIHRFGELLPRMEVAELTEALALIEREAVRPAGAEKVAGLLAALGALSGAAASFTDVRADLAQAALQRILTLSARDLLDRALAEAPAAEHPFAQAMQLAPTEVVRVLLELAGDDEHVHTRRGVVDLLVWLTAGRADLLAAHVVDPRWHVAWNAVAVLARVGLSDALPYLRAALGHEDSRVHREALRAIAALGTPDAMEAIAEAALRPDGETQAAAAHWLGVMGRPEAVGVLVALLERTPLWEQVDVKREVIRALGRLGTAEASEALRSVAAAETPLLRRRQVDELKKEAAAALAQLGEAGR